MEPTTFELLLDLTPVQAGETSLYKLSFAANGTVENTLDTTLPLNSGDIAVEQAEDLPNSGRQFVTDDEDSIDPNQVTLEQAIDSAIESAEEAKDALAEAVKTVDEIFPTEITGIPNGDTISDTDDEDLDLPTFEDTMDLVKEQQEEELEEEDDTFEL